MQDVERELEEGAVGIDIRGWTCAGTAIDGNTPTFRSYPTLIDDIAITSRDSHASTAPEFNPGGSRMWVWVLRWTF